MLPFAWWSVGDLSRTFEVSESFSALDRVELVRIPSSPHGPETVGVVDTVSRSIVDPVVNQVIWELVGVSEDIGMEKEIPVAETVGVKDLVELFIPDILVVQEFRELMAVSEATPVDKLFSITESVGAKDTVSLDAQDIPVIERAFRELVALSESTPLDKVHSVAETVGVTDDVVLSVLDLIRTKSFRELMTVGESTVVDKSFSVVETLGVSDLVVRQTIEVLFIKSFREKIALSEDDNLSAIPSIASCAMDDDPFGLRARVEYDTGPSCHSVIIERNVNSSGWVGHESASVSPNLTGYTSVWYVGSFGESIRFRVRPFSQFGNEGAACETAEVIIGEF